MNLSQNRLALDIRVLARRINEIAHGKRWVTPDTALRLAYYFDMLPELWLGLQIDYVINKYQTFQASGKRCNCQVGIPSNVSA